MNPILDVLNFTQDKTVCKLVYDLNHDYLKELLNNEAFSNNDSKKFATLLSNYADKSKAGTEGKKV